MVILHLDKPRELKFSHKAIQKFSALTRTPLTELKEAVRQRLNHLQNLMQEEKLLSLMMVLRIRITLLMMVEKTLEKLVETAQKP